MWDNRSVQHFAVHDHADQPRRRFTHACHIKRRIHPRDAPVEDRRTALPVQDDVAIAPPDGRESGVKTLVDLARPQYAHIVGQVAVAAQRPRTCTTNGLRFEVDDLA